MMRNLSSVSVLGILCLAGCKPPASEKLKGPDKSVCVTTHGCEIVPPYNPPPPPWKDGPEAKAWRASLPPLISLPEGKLQGVELRYYFLSDSGECGKSNCFHGLKFDRSRVITDASLRQEFITFMNDRGNYDYGVNGCVAWPGHGIRISGLEFEQDLWIDDQCERVESWIGGGEHTSRTILMNQSERLKNIFERMRRNARRPR